MKHIDVQYADTMSEESKVVRTSKGDQHIHLCIYMIDPASIMTVAARRAISSFPNKTRSEATISNRNPPDLVPDTSSADDSDDETETPLTMSPVEIKVIRRLSVRTNVLPVIAYADSLTDERLHAIKLAVRKGLADAGLDFGVFGPSNPDIPAPSSPVANSAKRKTKFATPDGADDLGDESEEEDEEEDERQSRPVIKLRRNRQHSRSRTRRELSQVAINDNRPQSPDPAEDNVANIRFSAHAIAKTDLASLMPFALIAPEPGKRRHRPLSSDGAYPQTPASPVPTSEDGHAVSVETNHQQSPPSSIHNKTSNVSGLPEDLKGVFVRKYRWGTVDVLDPTHCDFAALRTAILSTHLKLLKTRTKEVLYEKYRTEKLLARRATQQINDNDRQRLLEDLGL
ncbi:hypothetical protein AX16_008011 [Volvariella volvacea WC 439]|nr:hypothetical protein AX16_008011 [Volvariella volvacea WC 439]